MLLPRLRRFALSLTGSHHSADDLVQGACERALVAADSWTPGTRLHAWMFRILRNFWIDTHRRRRTEQLVSRAVIDHGPVCTDGEREIEARLMLKRVRSAIAGLPRENRKVLIIVCIEDMSYRAVAERLGIPVGTVMSRLSRARLRLAEAIGSRG
jgi:RNA polymerase sigma-70 factor, ECF subfamily